MSFNDLAALVIFFSVIVLFSILIFGCVIHTMSENVKYLNDILTKIFNEVKK